MDPKEKEICLDEKNKYEVFFYEFIRKFNAAGGRSAFCEYEENVVEVVSKIGDFIEKKQVVELRSRDTKTLLCAPFEFQHSIDSLLRSRVYTSMNMLRDVLNLPIQKFSIFYHYNNNIKNGQNSVPFAFENKYAWATNRFLKSSESFLERGIRIRAEHAVLLFFLTEMTVIPRCSENQSSGFNHSEYRKNKDWYPNYPEVCKILKAAIKSRSLNELTLLCASFEAKGITKLSTRFKPFIEKAIKEKCSASSTLLFQALPPEKRRRKENDTEETIFSEPINKVKMKY